VGVCLAVLAWRVDTAAREADVGWWAFTKGPVLFAVVTAVVLCAGVASARLIRGASLRHRAWPAFAGALAAAVLAAIPIDFYYEDGCNGHATISPVAAVPFIALTRSETAVASYQDTSTLMFCFRGPGRPVLGAG
jgi:hypothetical protein